MSDNNNEHRPQDTTTALKEKTNEDFNKKKPSDTDPNATESTPNEDLPNIDSPNPEVPNDDEDQEYPIPLDPNEFQRDHDQTEPDPMEPQEKRPRIESGKSIPETTSDTRNLK